MAETEQTSALIPQPLNAELVFTGGLDSMLAAIRAKADAEAAQADPTTAAGRKALASVAYRVAQSKTFLDAAGKSLVDEAKKRTAAIDAERKRARDYLDELKATIRAPVDKWEHEHDRARAVIADVAAMRTSPVLMVASVAELRRQSEALTDSPDIPADTMHAYATVLAETRAALATMIAAAEQREAQAAELQRLRDEAAKAERAAADEALRREGEERARRDAAMAIADQAARAERMAQEAVRKERERAEAAARQTAEVQRLAEEADRKRAADQTHRAVVDGKAAAAIAAAVGLGADMSRDVVTAIARGAIPGVRMVY